MNTFGIYGSGFGLYGYLPAILSCGQQVMLPQRYQKKFLSRVELDQFKDDIIWSADDEIINSVQGLALALQPRHQLNILNKIFSLPNIKYLLLEKPLAPTPAESIQLFDQLINSKIHFRIGYNFRFTSGGKQFFIALRDNPEKLSIIWKFKAHHFINNIPTWKKSHSEGGGILRFYGIHIIALLAEAGYETLNTSEIELDDSEDYIIWRAEFSGKNLPKCEVFIDSKAENNIFQIKSLALSEKKICEQTIVNCVDPFDTNTINGLDRRVSTLNQLCTSLLTSGHNPYNWYAQTIKLWALVEVMTSLKEFCNG